MRRLILVSGLVFSVATLCACGGGGGGGGSVPNLTTQGGTPTPKPTPTVPGATPTPPRATPTPPAGATPTPPVGTTPTPTPTPSPVIKQSFSIPASDANTSTLVLSLDGNLWSLKDSGTGADTAAIVKLTPAGAVTEFSTSPIAATVIIKSLAAGLDGNVWFTARGSCAGCTTSYVGYIAPDGTITKFPIPNSGKPGPLVADSSGNFWFSALDDPSVSQHTFIEKVTPNGVQTQFGPVSNNGMPVMATAIGPDGNVWYGGPNVVGVLNLSGSGFTNFAIQPVRANYTANVLSIAFGGDGNLYAGVASSPSGGNGQADFIAELTLGGSLVKNVTIPGGSAGPLVTGIDGNIWIPGLNPNAVAQLKVNGTLNVFPTVPFIYQLLPRTDGQFWFLAPGLFGIYGF